MDSANSGSMQSSSGGDEEYDSRAESISAFLNSSSQSHLIPLQEKEPIATVYYPSPVNPISNPHHQQNSPSFFDSLSNYIVPFPQTPTTLTINSLPNLDPLWSKTLRLDPNCTHIGGLTSSSSSSNPFLTQNPPGPLPPAGDTGPFRPSLAADQPNLTRNSKKRSRASRRAPTTILTTDTSNFRAMVQEFTGIPAPPFSSSPFPQTRLDLFTSHSSPPPYLLRPFPHKPHQPTFASSESNTNIVSNTTNSTSTPSNFHHQNLLNMQNPTFTFKSLLQTSPKYPKLPQAMDSQLKMGMLDDFTMYQGHVNTNLSDNSPRWGDGVGSSNGDPAHLRDFNGYYSNSQRVSTCKMNYTAPLSDFNGEKVSENVNSRREGIVDSWICSSD